MQLIELLEIPQLVDACARNGFHEEALELANFVNGLESRHLLATEMAVESTPGVRLFFPHFLPVPPEDLCYRRSLCL